MEGSSPGKTKHPSSHRHDLLHVDARWAWHYRALVALRHHLMAAHMGNLSGTTQPAAITPGIDRMERGPGEFDHDFALALLAQEQNALTEISAAIERILRGSYGVCERTGLKIPAERLRALPWTRYVRDRMEPNDDGRGENS